MIAGDKEREAVAYTGNALEYMFRYSEGRAAMALFEAYFDESGIHAGSDVVVVAGCIIDKDRAVEFSSSWDSALSDFGLKFWHSTEFESRIDPFDKLGNGQRASIQKQLSDILCSHISKVVVSGFRLSDYSQALKECGVESWSSPYTLSSLAVISKVADWCRQNQYTEPVRHIFDRAKGHAKEFYDAYMLAFENPDIAQRMNLGGLSFENKKKYIPLQGADKLAYEAYKLHDNVINHPEIPERKSFLAIANQVEDPLEFFPLGTEYFVSLIKRHQEHAAQAAKAQDA